MFVKNDVCLWLKLYVFRVPTHYQVRRELTQLRLSGWRLPGAMINTCFEPQTTTIRVVCIVTAQFAKFEPQCCEQPEPLAGSRTKARIKIILLYRLLYNAARIAANRICVGKTKGRLVLKLFYMYK